MQMWLFINGRPVALHQWLSMRRWRLAPPLWQSWLVVASGGHFSDSAAIRQPADNNTPFSLDLKEWIGQKEQAESWGSYNWGGQQSKRHLLIWYLWSLVPICKCLSPKSYCTNITYWHDKSSRNCMKEIEANSFGFIFRNPYWLLVMILWSEPEKGTLATQHHHFHV